MTPARARGVALITALLVVAVATTATVAMTSREHISIRRTGNLLDASQAWRYALGAEGWARHILADDDAEVDAAGDDWARRLPPMPVEAGRITGHIEDLQGRFNVNNLLDGDEISELDRVRFERLLRLLEIDPQVTQAIMDWLDADIEPRYPAGAEDDDYLNQTPAYRTANAPMVDPSELRLVRGIDAETYRRLAPYVTALPRRTAINVNTAPAPVLASLAEGLTLRDAQALIEARGEDGFAELGDFLAHEALAGREVPAEGLGVASGYFRVNVTAQVGRARLALHSVLHRLSEAEVDVVTRTRGYAQ